ncbi:Glycine cleavage system transcriptional antiactivator GcvR [hydrothermal vent metagenome]|uniref:Glycine cleavage system transcriptional antiactivator GcvR n=1 Tax=hydrothermal vent metagenome TaxID=652676 RepID=A0A3B0X0I1_9ZZZZ
MNPSLVITAIGKDRPGIVNELTEALLNAQLNIEDSRMSVLGGEFAVMLLVTGSKTSISAIEQNKDALSNSLNLNLLIKATSSQPDTTGYSRYKITVHGMDNPGIVHKLAHYLSQQSINIVNMQTESRHAPHTGTPLFSVHMQVDIPTRHEINHVQDEFCNICDELNMDAEFESESS